jgi:hypothetical protein
MQKITQNYRKALAMQIKHRGFEPQVDSSVFVAPNATLVGTHQFLWPLMQPSLEKSTLAQSQELCTGLL